MRAFIFILCFLSFPFALLISQTRWYVAADAPGTQTGLSWEDAFVDLQDALGVAVYGDEIWVAQGVYYPTSGTDEAVSFVLPQGVKIYGGFCGSEQHLWERESDACETVLSGDIGEAGVMEDNVKTIMYIENPDSNNLLDGLVFRDGYADGEDEYYIPPPENAGGAIYCFRSDTLISFKLNLHDCTFENNWANNKGGALFVTGVNLKKPMDVLIEDCLFQGNGVDTIGDAIANAQRGGGSIGVFPPGKDVLIKRTSFVHNFAYGFGAALVINPRYLTQGVATVWIDSCLFENNVCLNQSANAFGTTYGPGSVYIEAEPADLIDFRLSHSTFRYNQGPYCSGLSFYFNEHSEDSCIVVIEDNVFEGNENNSLYFYKLAFLTPPRDLEVIIRNNYFSNNSRDIGLVRFEASIYGNVFEEYSYSGGILKMQDMQGYYEEPLGDSSLLRFYNNTCYGSWNNLFYLQGQPNGYSYLELENNLLLGGSGEPWASLATFEVYGDLDHLFNMKVSHNLMSFPDSTFIADADYEDLVIGPGMQYGIEDADLWNPPEGDFRLRPCSPAVNAGSNEVWSGSAFLQDFSGSPRIQDGVVDLGAYETDSIEFELSWWNDASCASAPDGGALFSAGNYCDDVFPGYELSWDGGSVQNSLWVDGLLPGAYHFTLTDAVGRMAEAEVEIGWEDVMWDLETSVVPTLAGVNQGQVLILNVEGGQPPYTYLWDDGDTSAFHTGLAAGWHAVTITDSQGCTYEASWEVEVYTSAPVLSGTDIRVGVWPNPLPVSVLPLHFEFSRALPMSLRLRLYSTEGMEVSTAQIPAGSSSYSRPLSHAISQGLYFWALEDDHGQRLLYGKVVVF